MAKKKETIEVENQEVTKPNKLGVTFNQEDLNLVVAKINEIIDFI